MQLGRVIGTVVATVKADGLEGVRLLIVEPLDESLAPAGRAVVAADAVETAGPGALVYVVASREAAEALDPWFVPVDHAIVGLVDEVDVANGADEVDVANGADEVDVANGADEVDVRASS